MQNFAKIRIHIFSSNTYLPIPQGGTSMPCACFDNPISNLPDGNALSLGPNQGGKKGGYLGSFYPYISYLGFSLVIFDLSLVLCLA